MLIWGCYMPTRTWRVPCVAFIFVWLWTATAHATVERLPIKSSLTLKPGETYHVALDTTEPAEIGWTVQGKACPTNCIQAEQQNDLPTGGHVQYSIAASVGASKIYQPVSGKITIEYKNISNDPVTFDIYRLKRICDSEACKFLVAGQKGHSLVYLVDEFQAIQTSNDASYSDISGVAVGGHPFHVKVLWWTDDKMSGSGFLSKSCIRWITKFVTDHWPKEKFAPYILAGQALGDGNGMVLTSIDNCSGPAPNYKVPDQNLFK
jgi:hypothetical protein